MPGQCRVAVHGWSVIWVGSAGRRSLWRSWATLREIAQHKQMVYGWVTACQDDRSDGVIRNFADKETERLFATGMTRKLPQSIVRRRSEEHTSELQSLMRISYAVFCLKKKKNEPVQNSTHLHEEDK